MKMRSLVWLIQSGFVLALMGPALGQPVVLPKPASLPKVPPVSEQPIPPPVTPPAKPSAKPPAGRPPAPAATGDEGEGDEGEGEGGEGDGDGGEGEGEEEPKDDGEEGGDGGDKSPVSEKETQIGGEGAKNPLNPLEDDLDKLVQTRINDDLWKAVIRPLPCSDTGKACVDQLTSKAIAASPILKAIDERVSGVNEKIEEARASNKKTVDIGVFKPIVQAYLKLDRQEVTTASGQKVTTTVGPIQRIVNAIRNPLSAIDEILGLIGVPLFERQTGTNAEAQQNAIAISDLQVKVASIEAEKVKIVGTIREQVVNSLIDFDGAKRDFQIGQEVVRRAQVQQVLRRLDYRFGGQSTESYLSSLNAMDNRKAQTYKDWARLRSSLARLKLLVLGFDAGLDDAE